MMISWLVSTVSCQPAWSLNRWCRRQRAAQLSRVVGPPWSGCWWWNGSRWSMSHRQAGCRQDGNWQVSVRAADWSRRVSGAVGQFAGAGDGAGGGVGDGGGDGAGAGGDAAGEVGGDAAVAGEDGG